MPRYILKFTEDDRAWYLEWTSICDAPVVFGMSLEEFKKYYRDEYGRVGSEDLAKRLERVEAKGTSSMLDASLEDFITHNRAGKDGTELSMKQIIDYYCKWYCENDEDWEKHKSTKPVGEIKRDENGHLIND